MFSNYFFRWFDDKKTEELRHELEYFPFSFFLGHVRTLPRLVKAPFRYATYAHKYLDVAKRLTTKPLKQAVITASALSLVYTPHLFESNSIDNYSREQFLHDLIRECEKDIRLCLGKSIENEKIFSLTFLQEHGAHVVQLDFTEARLSLKVDPTGQLLKEFIELNNRVLDRFTIEEQKRIGIHVCPGGDFDCSVS